MRERALARAAELRDAVKRFVGRIETRQLLLRAAGRALFGIWLIWLNPFDLFHKADEASSNAFQYFMTPFIRHKNDNPPITVVLFTPSGLSNIREALEIDDSWTWPLTFDQQAQILRKIAGYAPRAIFYDIEFYQPRGSAGDFRGALQATTGVSTLGNCLGGNENVPGIPVFLAQPPVPEKIWEPLCSAGTQAVNVDWSGRPNVYPLAVARKGAAGGLLSPAAALLRLSCRQGRPWAKEGECFFSSTSELVQRDPLNLIWRSDYRSPRHSNLDMMAVDSFVLAECDYSDWYEQNSVWHDLATFVRSIFLRSASSSGESAVTTCPAPVVIGVDQLVLPQRDDTALRVALQNRAVFIGADFPGLRDRIATPFHGMVPGVFAHATAFDNLLERGSDYIAASKEEALVSWDRALQLLIVWVALFATMIAADWLRKQISPLSEIAYERKTARANFRGAAVALGGTVVMALLVFLMLLAISCFFFFERHEAPLDWIGELALVWLLTFEETINVIGRGLVVFPLAFKPVRAAARYLLKDPKEEAAHA